MEKSILEKRIEERAGDRLLKDITEFVKLLGNTWIANALRFKDKENGGSVSWHLSQLYQSWWQERARSLDELDRVFWFKEPMEKMRKQYIQEETDKFLTQINLVKELLEEKGIPVPESLQEKPVETEDVPF